MHCLYRPDSYAYLSFPAHCFIHRVHRIGQKRAVRIVRFVMAGSIEERMVSLQETKAAIAKGSMEKLKPDEVRKARIGDLKSLFDIVTE